MTEQTKQSLHELNEQFRRGELGRRDFLRRVVVLGGSASLAFGLLKQNEAAAQQPSSRGRFSSPQQTYPVQPQPVTPTPGVPTTTGPTTQALGEEGSPSLTTFRYGEENTTVPSSSAYGEEQGPPEVTTFAVGEEQSPNCRRETPTSAQRGEETSPPPTTQAIGEENQVYPPPTATTFAVGEESQTLPSPPPTNQPKNVTTRAVGEEGTPSRRGSAQSVRTRIESGIRNQIPKVWNGFRRW